MMLIIIEVTTNILSLRKEFSKTECANVNKSTFQFEYTPSFFRNGYIYRGDGDSRFYAEVSDSKKLVTIEGFLTQILRLFYYC
jgi:hypothetical protein